MVKQAQGIEVGIASPAPTKLKYFGLHFCEKGTTYKTLRTIACNELTQTAKWQSTPGRIGDLQRLMTASFMTF